MEKNTNNQQKLFARIVGSEKFTGLHALSYGIHDFKYLKGAKAARTQTHYTVHYVIEGEGHLHINNTSYVIKRDEFFVLAPDVLFAYYPNDNNPWKYIWIGLTGDWQFIEDLFLSAQISIGKPQKIGFAKSAAKAAFLSLEMNDSADMNAASLNIISTLYQFLSAVYKEFRSKPSVAVPESVIKITDYVINNYLNPNFSVAETAKKFSLSHPYMCRLFFKHTGTTIKSYVLELRLKKAKELLSLNGVSVKEAAYASGFSDDIYFSKAFRRRFKMTAGEYKKSVL